MLLPWHSATFIKKEKVSESVYRFWFKSENGDFSTFKAGQFVTLDLPIHEKRHKRLRSYSLASVPDDNNIFELIIVLVPNGLGTNYLFNNLEIGTVLKYRGPQGVFHLPKELSEDLVFICTGTGIAPFRAMIEKLKPQLKQEKLQIHLVFGSRTENDLLYRSEFEQLANEQPNFTYLPTLSRADELWKGTKGYVHPVYLSLIKEKKLVVNKTQFYLCGWQKMVDEAKEKLKSAGATFVLEEIYG